MQHFGVKHELKTKTLCIVQLSSFIVRLVVMCTYTLHQIHRLTITYMTMFIVRCDILEYMTLKSNQTCHFYHGIYDNIHVNVIFHGCNLKRKHTSF